MGFARTWRSMQTLPAVSSEVGVVKVDFREICQKSSSRFGLSLKDNGRLGTK